MAPTLYYLPEGPPTRGVLFLIRYLNIDVELKLCRTIMNEHMDPKFVKLNPCHTVPVLVDGDLILIDSQAIGMYLVEQYGSKSNLLGNNAKEHALINQRLFFNANLFDEIKHLVAPVIYEGQTKYNERTLGKVKEMIGFVESFLSASTYVACDKLTIADFFIVNNINSLVHLGFDFSQFKHINDWISRIKVLTGYTECDEGAKGMSKMVLNNLK